MARATLKKTAQKGDKNKNTERRQAKTENETMRRDMPEEIRETYDGLGRKAKTEFKKDS